MNSTHVERMVDEVHALAVKMNNLESFINGYGTDEGKAGVFPTLPDDEQDDLREQLVHMQSYANVLNRRIERAGGKS